MTVCSGRGDQGDHCCYINGQVCPLLVFDGDVPRCSVWGQWDSPEYLATAAAAFYEERWPGRGYTCGDWPQNIPEVMSTAGFGLCCWGVTSG